MGLMMLEHKLWSNSSLDDMINCGAVLVLSESEAGLQVLYN